MLVHLISILPLLGISSSLPAVHHARVVGRDTALNSSYDFVIIGGGTSGLTVADRLTENPDSQFNSRYLRKGSPADALC